ncbi:unnamed protein product [Closterium sp. NIES-54]
MADTALTADAAPMADAAPAAVAASAAVVAPTAVVAPATVTASSAAAAPIAVTASAVLTPAAVAAPANTAPAPRRSVETHHPAEPRRAYRATLPCRAVPRCPFACSASAATAAPNASTATASTATASTTATATMASPTVLTFDAEGRAVDFDVWVDNLQLFLQCASRDGASLFYHTSSVSTAPAATADNMVCSQWTTRDAVARLAARIARYSSPATAALSRLMLPYLFPDLAACDFFLDIQQLAEETARLFISTIVRLHGIPSAIINDRDPKFTSKFWKEMWAQYGTKLQFSSAYHPQTDGQTEQTNQTMEQLIRTNCPDPARWEDSLAMLEFAFNNAPSSTTNYSPFFLNYGMDPMVPTTTTLDNPVPWSQTFVTELQEVREKAANAIRKANTNSRKYSDILRRDLILAAWQLVLIDTKNLRLPGH